MAIKVIAVIGVFAFALLGFTSIGLKSLVRGSGARRVAVTDAKSPFNGPRAFEDLATVVGFGPRISGSKALAELRALIKTELAQAGLAVDTHSFEADTPIGPLRMANVVGAVKGNRPGVIILGTHYETKYFPGFEFVGANDGGSTTAWMIEMARALGPEREGRSVWLCFFDGEEAFEAWSDVDGLYGSRAFVQRLRKRGDLSQVHAMINVDMIGDCFLGVKRDRFAPPWLTRAIWGTARDLGHGAYFLPFRDAVEDDHVPFRRAGLPAANIIDFSYGGSAVAHRQNWHTANDTLERVCGESLQVVGDVIYHALPLVDAYLDNPARE